MAGRRTWRTRATVLSRTKLSEQDLILTLLSEDGCEVRAVAKGARKPSGKLAGRVELFCEIDVLLARGRNLDIVSEASLLDARLFLRRDPEYLSAAETICEIARLTCFADTPDSYLYPILTRALAALGGAGDAAHVMLVVSAYAFKVLAHAGWYPELSGCVMCGDEQTELFSPESGGVLCTSCGQEIEGAFSVSDNEIQWLQGLIKLTFDDLLRAEIDEALAYRLAVLVHRWSAVHLEARLRAFEFLLGL